MSESVGIGLVFVSIRMDISGEQHGYGCGHAGSLVSVDSISYNVTGPKQPADPGCRDCQKYSMFCVFVTVCKL
jgi:hypothetical protein